MKTVLFALSLFALLAFCKAGSFDVTDPSSSDDVEATSYDLFFQYVPDATIIAESPDDFGNVTNYYLHIEYDAVIIDPVGIFVTDVVDQAEITGLSPSSALAGQPFFSNQDTFPVGPEFGFNQTIVPIIATPEIVVDVIPPNNAVQGTQITIVVAFENFGTRRPVVPCVEFEIPGLLVDIIGASANRPNVTINITKIDGNYFFEICWLGAVKFDAASDMDVTIDLFVHPDACQEFAAANTARSVRDIRASSVVGPGSSVGTPPSSSTTPPTSSSTPPTSSVVNSGSLSNNNTNETSSQPAASSSNPVTCPIIDTGDSPASCRPVPHCPADIETVLPKGACGGFCIQGVVFPDYDLFNPDFAMEQQRSLRVSIRNFADALTDDPTQNGTADPTFVFFFATVPNPISSGIITGSESSSSQLVIILLPLFLGLLCLLCLAILIAALLAALWWFLTGREKMRTRVQWIPGRGSKGESEDAGL